MHDGIKKANATSLTYALTLSAKLKKGQFVVDKKSRGFCDIDLITADVQTGIPVIQDGDFAFVSVNDTDILSSLPRPIGDGCIEACCGCWITSGSVRRRCRGLGPSVTPQIELYSPSNKSGQI